LNCERRRGIETKRLEKSGDVGDETTGGERKGDLRKRSIKREKESVSPDDLVSQTKEERVSSGEMLSLKDVSPLTFATTASSH